ncbi:MAG: ABC transporter substrate-binding protein [Deltaproteobacteria bacterium]|nr:MAG: ABC transporter substrate-binding protein [Deltaproteobacteria bacterium]
MATKSTVLALIAWFLLLRSPNGYAQERARIGYGAISIQSGLVWIAKDKGLFGKYGLSPEIIYIPGGSTNVQVLVSGNLDFSQLSGAPGAAANLSGADIVYIAAFLDKLNYQLVTRPEIKSTEQLKGKKLGVSRFASSADFGLRAMLKKLGLDPAREVSILQIGDEPARLAAVKSGNIDGTVMNAPFGIEAERQHLYILADSLKMGIPFFNTGILATRRFLDQNEAKTLNLLRAYLEAIKVFKTDKEYSLKAMAQFTRLNNLKALEEGYDYFKDVLPNVPYPSLEAMQAVVTQLAETNPKAKGVDARSYISDRHLKRLEDEGFVKRLWGK